MNWGKLEIEAWLAAIILATIGVLSFFALHEYRTAALAKVDAADQRAVAAEYKQENVSVSAALQQRIIAQEDTDNALRIIVQEKDQLAEKYQVVRDWNHRIMPAQLVCLLHADIEASHDAAACTAAGANADTAVPSGALFQWALEVTAAIKNCNDDKAALRKFYGLP